MLDNLKDKNIILASKSPRRQELLKGLDIPFEIRTRDVDESYPPYLRPDEVPEYLAEKKAAAFAPEMEVNDIIITSDTIVIHQRKILEKPKDRNEAYEMIRTLSGSTHTVVTGVCIQSLLNKIVFKDETQVTFMSLTDEEINYYIDKYEPYDKAGSYGVQEWIGYVGIEQLIGSYFNVMGLPVHKLYAHLKAF